MQDEISWKKIRAKSGGHLYHHIHELDCTLFIMDETPSLVSMAAGNVAHKGEKFGDEDDVVLITLEFESGRFATLQWGSSFHYPEHYVLIEGTTGAILIDMQDTAGYLIKAGKKHTFLCMKAGRRMMIVATVTYPARWMAQSLMVNPVNVRRCGSHQL